MKRRYGLKSILTPILALVMMLGMGNVVMGQGLETFDNFTLNQGSYFDGSFVGENEITWNYIHVTGAAEVNQIDGNGMILRRSAEGSRIFSDPIPGGIGNFSVQLRKAFAGSGDRQAELFVNGISRGTSEVFGSESGADETVIEFSVEDINVAGNVIIEIRNIQGGTNNRQFTIDNIEWTGFESNDPLLVSSVTSINDFFAVEDGLPSSTQSFEIAGDNLDGSSVVLESSGGFEVSFSEGFGFSDNISIPAYDGSSTEVFVRLAEGLVADDYSSSLSITGGGADEIFVSLSGTVFPTFDIPYSNAFRNQTDLNRALFQGFELENAALNTAAGGRIDISADGFVQTPVIDFTAYEALNFEFDVRNFFGGIEHELSIGVSVDGGNTFTEVKNRVFQTGTGPGDDLTISLDLDLGSEFNSENGVVRVSKVGGENAFRFRDLLITETTISSIAISGDAGWRLLSLPVSDVPVSVLAGQNQVQGVSGADAFYGDTGYDAATPNLILFGDEAGDAVDAWEAPSGINSTIASGQGFGWYFFNNTNGQSVELPFNLTVSGVTPQNEVTRNLNNNQDFNLLGNPFNLAIVQDDVSGDIQAGFQVWDAAAEEYQTVSGVAEFQGFFAELQEGVTDGTVTFTPGDGIPLPPGPVSAISLRLNGVDSDGLEVNDTATRMVFSENGSMDWDVKDLRKLTPLIDRYALISFRGERAGETVNQVVASRPLEFQDTMETPLSLDLMNVSGEFTLSAEFDEIPESWSVMLLDTETGETVDLRSGSYTFTAEGETSGRSAQGKLPANAGSALMTSNPEARFVLFVDPQPLSGPIEGELPRELALDQNYPNPFNPTTQIRYELPESADVRLDVFNIQGQRVATLVSSNQSAGRYNVNFDASALASGVYIYRLQAGNTALTRKMTLIK